MNLILFEPGDIIALNAEAEKLIEDALAPTALVGKVASKEQQDEAVSAVQAIHDLIALITEAATETGRVPFLKWEKIHAVKNQAVSRLRAEEIRVNALCGDFQQLEAARLQGAVQAQRNTLTEMERQKAADKSKAASHEELDAIDFRYAAMAQQQAHAIVATPLANGQSVKHDWEITVTDPLALWRAFPQCVEPYIRKREVKELLDIHGALPGIEAKKVIVSKVRRSKEQKPLDV